MKKIIGLFIFIFLTVLTYGQSGNSSLISTDTLRIVGAIKDESKKPIEYISILVQGTLLGANTDENGLFEINIPHPDKESYTLVFQTISYEKRELIIYKADGLRQSFNIVLKTSSTILNEVEIIDQSVRDKASTISIDLKKIESIPTINQSVEDLLSGNFARKGSELTNQYSVRGGNFDENLVYVNDFEIYRPLLQTSGQQEGLSFINPDLVEKITFSAGGFEASYGDKLSSVLNIQYKRPKSFHGSVSGSILGASAHLEGATKNQKFAFLTGFRYKTNKYLFGNLDISGQYTPNALDFQTDLLYRPNKKTEIELLFNHASNKYDFQPEVQSTTTGAVNQVIRLTVYFDGKENDLFKNTFGGLSIKNQLTDRFSIKWLASAWKLQEEENYDITGAYSLGEVESDFSKDNFGQVKNVLGYGLSQDWGRNKLEAIIANAGFKGFNSLGKHFLSWGNSFQMEMIDDRLSEWQRQDSAGYSIPYNGEQVNISYSLKSTNSLNTWRNSGYIQDTWDLSGDSNKITMTIGVRYNYWSYNKNFNVSPRLQFSFKPNTKKDVVFRIATGWYTQPPFYREIRDFDGNLHPEVVAQKALHVILGSDLNFQGWGRNFKFTSELYYKLLKDVNPYELQDVRIRYFADNNTKGHTYGVDLRLFGEFVKGTDSWVSLSYLSTKEDLLNDFYKEYYNAKGEVVTPYVEDQAIVDSATIRPGFIPRPTDQRFSFSMFFQDYIPKAEFLKMSLGLTFGTGVPFGPPDRNRYRDIFRAPAYRRVDIGFAAILLDSERENFKQTGFFSHLDKIVLSFDVYNLLGVQNTISYKWVKDFQNILWPLPNYLTNRRFNLKLNVKF